MASRSPLALSPAFRVARKRNRSQTPSDEGTFTDTAHYVGLVPECTNLSIGYENAHSGDEYQDYGFLAALLPALLGVDWHRLPVARVCDHAPWPEQPSLAARMAGADLPALMGIVESGRFPSRAALIRALGPRLGAELASQEVRHWDPMGHPFAPAPAPHG